MSVNFLRHHQQPIWPDYIGMVFRVSAGLFMTLFVAEYAVPGFVTSWFNPLWLLIIATVSGVIFVSYYKH